MKTSKNGLHPCGKAAPEEGGGTDFLTAVFIIIFFLLFALQTGAVLKDLAEGKQPPYLWNGAPPPCVAPSQGAWPECHESGHK